MNNILDQQKLLLATDFDDTLVASGGWKLKVFNKFMGGVDASYPRGVSYPGIGALLYLLSLGPHKRDTKGNYNKLKSLESSEALPIVLASARPSIRIGFRPKFMYKHIAKMFTHEVIMLRGAVSDDDEIIQKKKRKIKYENTVPLMAAIRGKEEKQKKISI